MTTENITKKVLALLDDVEYDQAHTILENLVREVFEEKKGNRLAFLVEHFGDDLVKKIEAQVASPTEITALRVMARATVDYRCHTTVVVEPDEIDTDDKLARVAQDAAENADDGEWEDVDGSWKIGKTFATKVVTIKVGEKWRNTVDSDVVVVSGLDDSEEEALVFFTYDDGSCDSSVVADFLDNFKLVD